MPKCHPFLGGGSPFSLEGVPHPTRWEGVPQFQDGSTPISGWRVPSAGWVPPSPRQSGWMGSPHWWIEWGTPPRVERGTPRQTGWDYPHPVGQDKGTPPVNRQTCENITSRHPSDAGGNELVNKLLVADVQDEDSQLSRIIEVVTTVYDHQNFLTKGFLSKIPGIQYQHIVSTIIRTSSPRDSSPRYQESSINTL